MDTHPVDEKEKFIHRDLSWLSFNERVLEEAVDPTNPLLERIKFLAIFANNLDEFLMVRVAGLKRLLSSEYNRKDDFGYFPPELFSQLQDRVGVFFKKIYDIYKGEITGLLDRNKILVKTTDRLNAEQKKAVKWYFETVLYPIVTPMAVDEGHPFPTLPSKTTAFAILLERDKNKHLAILPIPKSIPRLLRLPSEKDESSFMLIDSIIRENLENFFRGYKILGHFGFRVIRDSELSVEEEYTKDLLKTIESEVKKRPKARGVSLQIEKSFNAELLELITQGLEFPGEQIIFINGDLDLTYLFELSGQVMKPELNYKGFVPQKIEYENIFDKIAEGDLLLHLPYQSFQPTIDLIQSAAKDKDVLAIKMTLCRVDEDSAIIKSLMEAAKNKKQIGRAH